MESSMMRVFQLDIVQPLVEIDMSMADDLNLRLVRNGLQIWV